MQVRGEIAKSTCMLVVTRMQASVIMKCCLARYYEEKKYVCRKPAPKWEQASMFVWNKLLNLSLSLLGFVSVSLWREHRYGTFVASTLVEVHHTIGQGI